MSAQAQYNNNNYKNWLRACLGMKYLKEGIVDFIDAEVKQLHASIVAEVCGLNICNQCATNLLTRKKRAWQCPNNVCGKILTEIEYQHRFNTPSWQNTDATKWCTHHWEIGKCFISPGYATISTAMETDCTGLLSICINGKFLPPAISTQIVHPSLQHGTPADIFHKNRDVRNKLLHSTSMSISDTERRDYIDDMTKLLVNCIPANQVTQAAIDKLKEVNSVDIDIYPALELSVLQAKIDAMIIRQSELENQVQEQSKETARYKDLMRKYEAEHQLGVIDVQDFLTAKYAHDDWAVPLCPLLRLHDVNVDEVYTELIVRDDIVDKPAEKVYSVRELFETEPRRRQLSSNAYQNVLYDGKASNKNIYVVGKAGMGKTTWCRKLVATWVAAMENKKNTWVPTEDESIFREFDLVFYIDLRRGRPHYTIMQMIAHQLFPDQVDLLTAAGKLLNTPAASSRCIIMLDGLDEWSIPVEDSPADGVPDRDPTWQCSTITTTRSWKLDELQLERIGIDRAVEIQSLTEDGTSKLIDDVVSRLNKSTGQNKMASDFKSQVSKSVKMCMQVPLMLTMIVCLWYDGIKINDHLAGIYSEIIDMLIGCAERDERKMLFEKISTEKLAEMKRKWSKEKHSHPDCLTAKPLFETYMPFLLRLGKVAFNRLVSNSMESTLVFEYQTIETLLPEDELELSVKTGILNKTTHTESTLEQECCLSFLHKTVQEYLAALYLVSADNKAECVNIFKTYDATGILKMQNVLLFISGLCPEVAGEISCYIADIDTDDSIRQSVHQSLLRCWRESRAASYTSAAIYIKHHFLYKSNDYGSEYNEETLNYLVQETEKGTSLCIEHMSEEDSLALPDLATCQLPKMPESSDDVKIHESPGSTEFSLDLSRCQSLRILQLTFCHLRISAPTSLVEVELNSCEPSTEWVLDLTECQSLRTLSCICCSTKIRVPNSLEVLTINSYETDSKEWIWDLSGCQSLRTLTYEISETRVLVPNSIQEMKIDWFKESTDYVWDLSGCQSLKTFCYTRSNPRIIVPNSLEDVTIDCFRSTPTEWDWDLSGCQSLKTLRYESNQRVLVPNSLEEVNICWYRGYPESVIDFSGCQSLRKIYCRGLATVRLVIPNCLEEADISGYDGPTEWVLDMSGCKSLRKLKYSNSDVKILVPDCLENVENDQKGTSDLCRRLPLRTLQNSDSSEQILDLVPNSLETVEIDLYYGPPEWVLDLSRCQSLRKLKYTNSDVKILVPNSLEKVIAAGLRIDQLGSSAWVLDLSGCQSLRTLQFYSSSVQILVPNSLEKVLIQFCTGPDERMIDLSGCQSLRKLSYQCPSVPILIPANLKEKMPKKSTVYSIEYTDSSVSESSDNFDDDL